MTPETKNLLLKFDEDHAWEFPSDFDEKDIERRARKVHTELGVGFGELRFEDWMHNQDASFGLAVILKSYERKTPHAIYQPAIRFSNFGNLATFTLGELLPKDARKNIIDCLGKNGFIYVDAHELDAPYDGVMAPKDSISTWWVRYFDWL